MSKSSLLLLLGLLTTSSVFAATPESTFLAQHGLSGKSVEQIVDAIDQSPQSRPLPYSASITSTELKLSSGEQVIRCRSVTSSISPLPRTNGKRTPALTTAFLAAREKCLRRPLMSK